MSYWAWATNKSTYHKQSAILFVLSIPFLVIIQILSLLLYGIQAVYKDKTCLNLSKATFAKLKLALNIGKQIPYRL
jgi:hypothetical protein